MFKKSIVFNVNYFMHVLNFSLKYVFVNLFQIIEILIKSAFIFRNN